MFSSISLPWLSSVLFLPSFGRFGVDNYVFYHSADYFPHLGE
nr:MAG TPA: hypothetical protein [Inoviridae sp.]